jgi:osmotically-inducible protein OsmY
MTTTARTTAPPGPTDAELQAAVVSELIWVKDVDATHIGVAASGGAVTLSGEVGSFPEKRLAVKAAQRVRGANGVADEMTVRTTFGVGNDTDVAREAGEAIERAVNVPPTVRVAVHDHVVTLSGAVTWQYQRVAAGRAVHYLKGVRDVFNLITISPGIATAGIRAEIGEALVRNAQVDGRTVTVTADSAGMVTLTGTVRSWGERRQAEQACWSAPGVLGVTDHLHVER